MQRLPQDELRTASGLSQESDALDNQSALRLKKRLAAEFRNQLILGVPTNADEAGLRRLCVQLKAGKVVVELFLRHSLHAKLYLLFRSDPINPIIGYLGSSNLTLAGLFHQGELNVDVLDHDATKKLAGWFEERWNDHWCVDITAELVQVIEESWAREELLPPYQVYVKMAYHLAQEARAGLSEFRIPAEFGQRLFEYQVAAVKIAAHHLNKRGGVLIGDVVGLGKTLMATTLAKIFQDDHFTETLILCPKNLVKMWEGYVAEYRLLAKVLSVTKVQRELPDLRRYRVVLIDESQNLRNREGKRYRAIQEYIQENESKCILLSATPYNKTYVDLSSQLRLFVPEDKDLGIRPERLLRELNETEFIQRHQCPLRSLAAFEKSEYVDDWRELMRLYMVRRTRSFIQDNYADTDPKTGRKYLTLEDGTHSYFPNRIPKTVKFLIDEKSPDDQYARLYAPAIVSAINRLNLPRYGLANYVAGTPHKSAAFDVERVTKRFYDRFQKEHTAFLKFVSGIADRADKEWYASVMLNRLMFVYFIQRKGFLDGDPAYLRNRLSRMRAAHGKDKFYSFYRYFLLRLFHEALGSKERNADLERLVGRIPYLNGGLFEVHELEKSDRYGTNIQIPDQAFERIFDYFDQYQWHLDERPLQADNEINPDVLGYIFEKYINQKQMGAYYTKEDITEYISKNTILPFLINDARSTCKVAFENPNGPAVWDLLRNDPDRYIYPAVRHGEALPLPEEIATGLDPPNLHELVGASPVETLELRKDWNKLAASEFGLPTETWREVVVRRKSYKEIKAKLARGEVCGINELITLDLDIRQFAQDVIENCEGPELLRALWNAIEKITVLDPTCGSGAFLFAAVDILGPLYEACLDRMETFVEDAEHSGDKDRREKFTDFRRILERVAAHPNRRYFVYKSITLNNLFGVDIMEEAVEICKLRLFLKLAAQVDADASHDNLGIEPLPDIDFNIRVGNTQSRGDLESRHGRIGRIAGAHSGSYRSDNPICTRTRSQTTSHSGAG